MLSGKGSGPPPEVSQRFAAKCSHHVNARRSACTSAWKTTDDVAGVMKYSKLLLRGRIDEFNGHIFVGKCLEQVHWHGRLL